MDEASSNGSAEPVTDLAINPGVVPVHVHGAPPYKTVIVTGTGRSGTTSVVRVLRALGIPWLTGDGHAQEPPPLIRCFKHRDWGRLQEIIDALNEQAPTWGWKYPLCLQMLGPRVCQFQNPIVFFAMRDLAAVTSRHQIEMLYRRQEDISSNEHQLRQYLHLLQEEMHAALALLGHCPVYWISCEKLLTETELVVGEIARAVDMPVTEDALQAVKMHDERYSKPYLADEIDELTLV